MTTLTVRQFMELGFTHWREIHWSVPHPKLEALAGFQVYAVGYEKKGVVTPFALWLVEK